MKIFLLHVHWCVINFPDSTAEWSQPTSFWKNKKSHTNKNKTKALNDINSLFSVQSLFPASLLVWRLHCILLLPSDSLHTPCQPVLLSPKHPGCCLWSLASLYGMEGTGVLQEVLMKLYSKYLTKRSNPRGLQKAVIRVGKKDKSIDSKHSYRAVHTPQKTG